MTLIDSRGIRHSVEVTAESLFEAGGLAVIGSWNCRNPTDAHAMLKVNRFHSAGDRASGCDQHGMRLPMTLRCADCCLPIEQDPWWYDPSALTMNADPQVTQPTAVTSQQPYPPTSVSGPFHKACLVKRMGHNLDSAAWS